MVGDSAKAHKLTIGRLARAGGVGVSTVRYYQRRGLLREPERPSVGRFRSYSQRDLEKLLLIKHSQELGFTLAEISQLVAYAEDKNCHAVRGLAEKKLQTVKTQIQALNNRRRALNTIVAECSDECSDSCLIFKRFASACNCRK